MTLQGLIMAVIKTILIVNKSCFAWDI